MLLSLAVIFICGFILSGIMQKFKLPGLLGMIITGIILGPYMLNLIAPEILNISGDLREIALIVILTRAGLALDIKDLKKVGRSALLMSFVPAIFEIIAIIIFAPIFFKISYIEAAMLGAVLAAVSPAVIIPRMLKLMNEGYGKSKSIPQLIMAGASVDDIFVIVLFASFLSMYQGSGFDIMSIVKIPVSIITGLILGIALGILIVKMFKKIHMRDTVKILVIFSVAFLLVVFETYIEAYIPMSGLLAIMALSSTILKQYGELATRLSSKFSKIWVAAELILFVLVGSAVDITYLKSTGLFAVLLILIALVFRTVGVYLSVAKTGLNIKEKAFCAIAYLPKATVQAALGSVPLSKGVPAGNIILTVAILSIIVTAPIGALGIDVTYKKFLSKE